MDILSGWIASRREEVHRPGSRGDRSKDLDVGRNHKDSRKRQKVWCVACGEVSNLKRESQDDLLREVCQKGSVDEERRRSGRRWNDDDQSDNTEAGKNGAICRNLYRQMEFDMILINWSRSRCRKKSEKMKFVVKKKEICIHEAECCVLDNDETIMRAAWDTQRELYNMKILCACRVRRWLKQTLNRNSGSEEKRAHEGHDLLRIVSAGDETLTWCRKCSRNSRFRLQRKLYNRFESHYWIGTLLSGRVSIWKLKEKDNR